MANAAQPMMLQCPPPPVANFDALATSFGALSVAIAFGSILVGLLAILVTIAWNRSTKAEAIAAARDEIGRRADQFMRTEGLAHVEQRLEEIATRHFASTLTSRSQGAIPNNESADLGGPLTR